jgi:hypothetical protein
MHSSPAAQLVRTHFREARQQDLAFGDKIRQRPDRILDRDVRVWPVKVIEVYHVRLQTLQARLAGGLDGFRTAIQGPLAIPKPKDAFAGQEKVLTASAQRFTDQFLTPAKAIQRRGVEKITPEIERPDQKRLRFVFRDRGAIGMTDVHASEAHRIDLPVPDLPTLYAHAISLLV